MKILFVIPSFNIGGTTTSLINLISKVDKEKYELFIYAINNEGGLMDEMSTFATVINSQSSNELTLKSTKSGNLFLSCAKSFHRILRSIGIDVSLFYFKRIAKSFDAAKYDCVIAFQEGLPTIMVSYCKYGKKVAWVRSEYKRYLMLAKKKPEVRLYSKFDKIVSVSETAINQFLKYLPQYRNKATYIYNLLNKERVLSMANEPCEINKDDVFTIVSIGRIDRVKRFSEIPCISKVLKNNGIVFRWLIIGGAQKTEMKEYGLIEKGVKDNNLEDCVFLMGKKDNPYCYLKNSNVLVCLSESETFNHTFGEARLLGVPIISTNYESAPEMLKENQGGIIVERDKITETLTDIILNKDRYNELCGQAAKYNYNNDVILEKFYEIIR